MVLDSVVLSDWILCWVWPERANPIVLYSLVVVNDLVSHRVARSLILKCTSVSVFILPPTVTAGIPLGPASCS